MTNGMNVAHGANSANLGRRLRDIVDNTTRLQGLVDGSELHDEFVRNAAAGGGWVGYWWRNAGEEEPYLKIALIALRVSRFGRAFYLGVGFNHRQSPDANGPHCAACKQNYNYPCAWANTKGLIGHCQSLIFMSNRHSVEEAFQLLSWNSSYGGGGRLNRTSERSADWLYPFVYDFKGTCVAHGANPSFVGKTLWDIINGTAALMGVQDGFELHKQFVAAASGEGRWVAYDWRNKGSEPIYRKLAFLLRVTREGRDFYIGAGLANYDWRVHGSDLLAQGGGTSRWLWGCSVERQHPCSEDWAMTVAGRRMSSMLQATSYEDLQASLGAASLRNETFGFETHVHNSEVVLWDGHDESFVNQTPGEWMSAVGLSTTDLEEYGSGGSWLGPFDMRLTRSGEIARRYVFYMSLSIEDELADGVKDGIKDTYYLLVAVSGAAPMMTAAPKSLSGEAYECLQRPSVSLNASAMVSEGIKCVTSLDEIASDPAHCSNVDKDGICPNSTNEWRDDAYSLDRECQRMVQDGSWENSTFCGCEARYAPRFAAKRHLGQADHEADLPDDARCSAPEHTCESSDDWSCVNRFALQVEYEQYCSLEPPPIAPAAASDSTGLYIGATAVSFLVVLAVVVLAVVRLLDRRAQQRRRSKFQEKREGKKRDGNPDVVPLIHELDEETEFKLEESERRAERARSTDWDALLSLTSDIRKVQDELQLGRDIKKVRDELERARDKRKGRKDHTEQCRKVIEEGGASSDVYEAVFWTIDRPESSGMNYYQGAAAALLARLEQEEKAQKESDERLVWPQCKQKTTDLAKLYMGAVSVKKDASNDLAKLYMEAVSVKVDASKVMKDLIERLDGLSKEGLVISPLKKMRCVLHASVPGRHLSSLSPVCVAAVAHVRRLSCNPRHRLLGLGKSVTLCA